VKESIFDSKIIAERIEKEKIFTNKNLNGKRKS
jgi:hypothetical protein